MDGVGACLLRRSGIMVVIRSMSANPSKILHHGGGKIPDQHLTTLEWRTTQMSDVTPMTDITLPLPPSTQAKLDAIADASSYCFSLIWIPTANVIPHHVVIITILKNSLHE
jgi:hypothetical protein